jgi:hypothetical protein
LPVGARGEIDAAGRHDAKRVVLAPLIKPLPVGRLAALPEGFADAKGHIDGVADKEPPIIDAEGPGLTAYRFDALPRGQ